MSSPTSDQTQVNYQQQYQKLKIKYQGQIKKNSSLLKMNTNLMKQNQIYLNCITMLKKWSLSFLGQLTQESQIIDQSVDIEQGQQFVQTLIQEIQKKINNFSLQYQNFKINTQTQIYTENKKGSSLERECQNCNRWKQLYIKQTTQTERLQKMVDQGEYFNNKAEINMVKLKDDISHLLEDYWALYRKQYGIQQLTNKKIDTKSTINGPRSTNDQTVRLSGQKSKQKSQKNISAKNKKSTSAFSKQKTNRQNKYFIQLKGAINQKQNNYQLQADQQKYKHEFNSNIEKYTQILSSYCECYKKLQQENSMIKEHLRQYNDLLNIYRQKQKNRILGR